MRSKSPCCWQFSTTIQIWTFRLAVTKFRIKLCLQHKYLQIHTVWDKCASIQLHWIQQNDIEVQKYVVFYCLFVCFAREEWECVGVRKLCDSATSRLWKWRHDFYINGQHICSIIILSWYENSEDELFLYRVNLHIWKMMLSAATDNNFVWVSSFMKWWATH